MKQILQNLSSGETLRVDVPAPQVEAGTLLIETEASLVSLGTEKMLVNFGKANLLDKARQQPEKVKQVLRKIKSDGLMPTIEVVRSKLDVPLPMGYCNVGRVVEVGPSVDGFHVGDRVLSNSHHAEIVCAPKNLCAKVPEGVEPEQAVYAVVGAIGLQGIRLLQPTLGETFVVTGLGLIGQLAVQTLIASGCRVIGIDFDSTKCELARSFGAEVVDLSSGQDPIAVAQSFTDGQGVDGVLITASTQSDEPIHQAATMCRKRGRIVLVGVVGMKMNRADFYEKELTFQVSCAYGPGRYDPFYEAEGHDYPLPFVRWTEQRNFEAILGLIASGRIQTAQLTSHCYDFDQALEAYGQVGADAMGIVLSYAQDGKAEGGKTEKLKRVVSVNAASGVPEKAVVGVIGAGNFTSLVTLPALKKSGARLKSIASQRGVSSSHLARKFGFENSTTENNSIFEDSEINIVFITTRHENHGALVLRALEAGKHVFVEKPLAIHRHEIEAIQRYYTTTQQFNDSTSNLPLLMVGFNRRFSPHSVRLKSLLTNRTAPLSIQYTVNAGAIPPEHWLHDRAVGGGRIIGEACHFVDWCRFLCDAPIDSIDCRYLVAADKPALDSAVLSMQMADGSVATVHYLSNGHSKLPKERIEVFSSGSVFQLDDFRCLSAFGVPGFKNFKTRRIDKGHAAAVQGFLDAVRTGGDSPIPVNEIFEVSGRMLEL